MKSIHLPQILASGIATLSSLLVGSVLAAPPRANSPQAKLHPARLKVIVHASQLRHPKVIIHRALIVRKIVIHHEPRVIIAEHRSETIAHAVVITPDHAVAEHVAGKAPNYEIARNALAAAAGAMTGGAGDSNAAKYSLREAIKHLGMASDKPRFHVKRQDAIDHAEAALHAVESNGAAGEAERITNSALDDVNACLALVE